MGSVGPAALNSYPAWTMKQGDAIERRCRLCNEPRRVGHTLCGKCRWAQRTSGLSPRGFEQRWWVFGFLGRDQVQGPVRLGD